MTATLTERQREILLHSLGLDHKSFAYRNFYCAPVNGHDNLVIATMVADGLMTWGPIINAGKDYYAFVTEAGANAVGAQLPSEEDK